MAAKFILAIDQGQIIGQEIRCCRQPVIPAGSRIRDVVSKPLKELDAAPAFISCRQDHGIVSLRECGAADAVANPRSLLPRVPRAADGAAVSRSRVAPPGHQFNGAELNELLGAKVEDG